MSALIIAGYTALVAVVLLFSLLCWATIKVYRVHKQYQHIPSVTRSSFYSGHSKYFSEIISDDSTKSMQLLFFDWYKKLGPVFCFHVFTVTVVIILDPQGIKNILFDPVHPKTELSYKMFMTVFGTRFVPRGLVAETDHNRWHKQRTVLNVAFHRKFLKDFLKPFNASTDLLLETLSHKADGKTEVTLLEHFNRVTLDVIAKVAFNLDLGIIEKEDSSFNKAILTTLKGMKKSLSTFAGLDMRSKARKFRKEVHGAITSIRQTGRESINARIDDMNNGDKEVPEDVLTYIIKAGQEVDGDDHQKMDVMIDHFATFFVAGQETTANVLSFTIIELCRHPEILHRLKTEVDAVLGDQQFVTYEHIGKMEYMMKVFKETLRLWPPAGITARTLKSDVDVLGYNIPTESMLMISMYCLGRMQEYYHNPEEFDPDRFTSDEDMMQYTYLPFSLGPRNCIGQHFAMIEAKVILARFLQTYSCELVPGQTFTFLEEVSLKPKDGCKVFLKSQT